MNRREMLKAVAVTSIAELPEAKRKALWFVGHTGEQEWTNGSNGEWVKRGECAIRMDQVTCLETVDRHGTCCVLVDQTPIILHPESYARFKRQWSEFWDLSR